MLSKKLNKKYFHLNNDIIMKKLKELNIIHDIFVDSINELDTKILSQMKKLKHEYQQNITEEKIKLIIAICNGEGLDFEKIKNKYLKTKEIGQLPIIEPVIEKPPAEESLLDIIEIEGIKYYYEAKEKGIVYDQDSKKVGLFKNGIVTFEKI
jgi:hypothetical protein